MVNKKLFKIIWDKVALDDFKETLNFLAKQSVQAPKIVKEGVLSRLDLIKSNALICEIDKLNENQDKSLGPLSCIATELHIK